MQPPPDEPHRRGRGDPDAEDAGKRVLLRLSCLSRWDS
jgi:hypothetical protein